MKYFDEKGVEIKDGIFTQEDWDKKIEESKKEVEGTVDKKVKELEETHEAKITEMKDAHKQQMDRNKGTKDEKIETLQKEMEELKTGIVEGDKELMDNLVSKKLEKLAGDNSELKEMLELTAKEKFKEIDSIEDVDTVFDGAFNLLKSDGKGKELIDNIAEVSASAKLGDEKKDDKYPSKESMDMFGNTKEDAEKYLNKK